MQDLELLRSWRNSALVSKNMYTSKYISQQDQLDWFRSIQLKKDALYRIVEINERKVGMISLTNIKLDNQSCFWAMYFGDTMFNETGAAAILEYFVIDYVFDELGLNKLNCEVLSFNKKVINLHKRFGFVIEANFREHCYKDGKWYDAVGLGLLHADWVLLREKLGKILDCNSAEFTFQK
jgi:UDP-4-amino-4,6-dideoxy-N-acetyl-beta-L-altrosamine N-acetyltransferase